MGVGGEQGHPPVSVGRELRERPVRPNAPLEEEEVDVGGLGRAIAARWWLPVLGLLAGVAVGYALSLGGGTFYRAQTLLFVGQPIFPSGSGQIPQNLAANPNAISAIIRSEVAIAEAARRSGLRPGQLRGRVSSEPARQSGVTGRSTGSGSVLYVTVQGSAPRKIERAADVLTARVIRNVSPYVDSKIETLRTRRVLARRNLNGVVDRLSVARGLQTEALENRGLGDIERLILITNLQSQISAAEARQATIEDRLLDIGQLLSLANTIERSYVIAPARAVETTARSTRTSVLAAAVIGLILGLFAALAWEPLRARRARTA